MLEISIQAGLKTHLPDLALGCVSADIRMEKHSESLWRDIDKHLGHLAASINSEQINC
jgi:hypothetical protein